MVRDLERVRAENERLRASLSEMLESFTEPEDDNDILRRARAALDPLERVAEEYVGASVRVDTDDEKQLVLLYVLKPGTNEAASVLTFGFDQARVFARWILRSTPPSPLEPPY